MKSYVYTKHELAISRFNTLLNLYEKVSIEYKDNRYQIFASMKRITWIQKFGKLSKLEKKLKKYQN